MANVKVKFLKSFRTYRKGDVARISPDWAQRWAPKGRVEILDVKEDDAPAERQTKVQEPQEDKEPVLPDEAPGPDDGPEATGEWYLDRRGGYYDVVSPEGVIHDTVHGKDAASARLEELSE